VVPWAVVLSIGTAVAVIVFSRGAAGLVLVLVLWGIRLPLFWRVRRLPDGVGVVIF